MEIFNVKRYPDPILRQKAYTVPEINQNIRSIINKMVLTMYHSPAGIGLAAPQVGFPLRIVIVDITKGQMKNGLKVLINPRCVIKRGMLIKREGCLSLPDFTANICRSTYVKVKAFNEHYDPILIEADGIEAVCIQHELDHINGILLIDRVSCLKTDIFRRKKYI